jgi:hypothetical protein
MPDQIVIGRGGLFAVPFLGIFQMGDSGLGNNAPGFLFLTGGPGGSG